MSYFYKSRPYYVRRAGKPMFGTCITHDNSKCMFELFMQSIQKFCVCGSFMCENFQCECGKFDEQDTEDVDQQMSREDNLEECDCICDCNECSQCYFFNNKLPSKMNEFALCHFCKNDNG